MTDIIDHARPQAADAHAVATIVRASGDTETMQCMEVWGGNAMVDATVSISGLDLWVYSKPYEQAEAGGDVYYLSSCATGRITRLLVADVSGHGAQVRDTAVTLRDLMRRHVNRLDQTQFVRAMNREFAQLGKAGTFATAVAMTFFGPTNYLTLCNAGHPSPLLYRASERRWSMVQQRDDADRSKEIVNIPLGIDGISDYEQFGIELSRGDLILCYSDSLIESRDPSGEMIGEAGLLRLVEQLDPTQGSTLIARLRDELMRLNRQNLLTDDVTMLLFRTNGSAGSAVPMRRALLAPVRIVGSIFRGQWALPDFSLVNLLGAVWSRFNRSWNASRFARH
jgi:serine phosphatase RsbU (regulator of sigma subunit)